MQNRLKIGLDCDDVLYSCNEYALDLINKKHGTNHTINEIKSWHYNDATLEERSMLFNDPAFFETQPLFPGAADFVHKLAKIADIYITTAAYPQCMSVRAMQIQRDFPEIPQDHIIIGASKNIYDLDIILDDRAFNIEHSIAKFPVLFRRPWNAEMSGVLSVNDYDDFLHIVNLIARSYSEIPNLTDGGVICLIGPSGSGKTAIMQELISDENFIKPVTTTTRARRQDEPYNAYHFVSKKAFLECLDRGRFLETTVYGGNHYGTTAESIDEIINVGKYAVIPIDICGAISLKNTYRDKAILVFIDRDKSSVISEIINRPVPNAEKVRRIVSLDWEYKNKIFCDAVIENDKTLKAAARKIKKLI